MKLLGIDFGSKKVGVAVADTEAGIAIPKAVFPNNKFLLGEIKQLIKGSDVSLVVMGESKNFEMKQNIIMQDANAFAKMLQSDGIDVVFEPEFMTSQQARRDQGDNEFVDASAAAIILQSYLDKQKNK